MKHPSDKCEQVPARQVIWMTMSLIVVLPVVGVLVSRGYWLVGVAGGVLYPTWFLTLRWLMRKRIARALDFEAWAKSVFGPPEHTGWGTRWTVQVGDDRKLQPLRFQILWFSDGPSWSLGQSDDFLEFGRLISFHKQGSFSLFDRRSEREILMRLIERALEAAP